MATMTITEFKAHALAQIDRVFRTREPLVITRHGKPIARVVPYTAAGPRATPGTLADMLAFERDIVSPLGESNWAAAGGSQDDDDLSS